MGSEMCIRDSYDAEVSPAFTGDVDLRVFESPVEELSRLAPREMIAGYWRSVGVSWNGGTTLADLRPGAGS